MKAYGKPIKIFCAVFLLSLLTACSSDNKNIQEAEYSTGDTPIEESAGTDYKNDFSSTESDPVYDAVDNTHDMKFNGSDSTGIDAQKIAMTYNLEMQTKEFEKSQKDIESAVSANKGFVEYSEVKHNDYYSSDAQYAHWIFKIPRESSGNALEELKTFGHLVKMQQEGENLTSEYQDTQSMVELYQMKEERLKELLNKAEKMEDIIQLEESITDTIYKRESLNKALKDMDKRVDYITVEMTLREVRDYTEPQTEVISFDERVIIAFKEMGNNIVYGTQDIILDLIYWLPLYVILIIIFIIIKLLLRKSRIKKLKNQKNEAK